MAEQAQTASSTFPNPPDFLWKDFTPDKIAQFEEIKKAWLQENPEAAESKHVTLVPNLPQSLQHLQPPPEPTSGSWRALGGVWTIKDELPTLEEAGIQRLEPTAPTTSTNGSGAGANLDRALNLKRLTKSALLNFLELVGVASIEPDGLAEKAGDIETILINIHNSLNEYRPHQARESLIQTMQDRLDQIRNETAAVNAVTDKAKRVLEGLGSIEAPTPAGVSVGEEEGLGGAGDKATAWNGLSNGAAGAAAAAVADGNLDNDELWTQATAFV